MNTAYIQSVGGASDDMPQPPCPSLSLDGQAQREGKNSIPSIPFILHPGKTDPMNTAYIQSVGGASDHMPQPPCPSLSLDGQAQREGKNSIPSIPSILFIPVKQLP